MKRKILSAILTAALLISNTAFAYSATPSPSPLPSSSPEPVSPEPEVSKQLTEEEISKEYIAYQNILTFIENTYIDSSVTKEYLLQRGLNNLLKDNPEAFSQLIKASVEDLDLYTKVYTKDEYADYLNSVNQVIYGIGIVMKLSDTGYIEINQIVENGPSAKVGLKEGDLIVAVDGRDIKGLDLDAVRALITGEQFTDVSITVRRDDREITYTVTRDSVNLTTVEYSILEDNIGYINISSFAENTAEEFTEAADELKKNGIKKLILDLRNNPGGYMMSAVMIASEIVPEGKIIEAKFRRDENDITYTSDLKEAPFQICVLGNENTASAAEILTSCIVDSGTGILVGDNTYGKALIQDMYRIPYDMAIKMTIGKYITRNGKEINKIGIEPNELVLNEISLVDASKYTPFEYKGKYNIGDTAQDIKAAEERLSLMGYNVGTVDDTYTQSTFDAIMKFQKDHELYPYGVLDNTTQVAINNVFLDQRELIDKQFEYAYKYLGGTIKE